MKAPTALQRGMACLCCRKRKMKCDGARPVCAQCTKANRGDECQYYEKKRTSRTQLLQAKITKLEARLRELEAEQSPLESSSSSGSQSPQTDRLSLNLSRTSTFVSVSALDPGLNATPRVCPFSGLLLLESELGLPFDSASVFSTPEDYLGNGDAFPPFDEGQLFPDFLDSGGSGGRFKAALLLPSARKPHPSLVDAIYLLACYFSRSPPLTELEPHFLKRSLRGISDALQNSDRIVHVLQASCLLACYFFWHGRTLEGYYHSSIAARLAVGLGLHQISSKEQQCQYLQRSDAPAPLKATVPLCPPLDEVEYAERIAAFWQIFAVDRAWAVATGLPTALPDDDHPRSRITTIWPIAIPDDPEPIAALDLQAFPGAHLSGSSGQQALRVKAIALFERSARFSASPAKDESRYSLEMSVSQYLSNLSSLHSQQFSVPFVSNGDYLSLQTAMYAATIHLHREDLEVQPQSYQRCLWAANAMAALVRHLRDNDYDTLCPIISTAWRSAAEVYLRVVAMPQQNLPSTVEVFEQQIDTVVGALQRLGQLFPVAGSYAARIQEDRAASRRSYVPAIA
ncbi:transcription factor [Ganoderma sinense ZZ0214-1]|uniref:Transcription factor n=1 Tax=Ganoderma sinense ZZ0214-1 TaxID=1077348 RepID=A0A2G8SA87_9APHY|nr:transcription factor [Ganoderma sinense ZZ0214-1]